MPRPQQRRARTASRPNGVAPEQCRAPTVLPWRGVAAIRRCRSCRSDEASSRLMPVGARHAAPEQRRARTAPRPNSVAPQLCCLGVASLQFGAAAVVALMKLHRVSCPSGRGMPRPNSAAPEQRRARTAPRPNSVAPEQRRARTAPRPNSVAPEQRRARTAPRWRGVAAIRRGSDHDGIVIPQPGAPARLRVGIKARRNAENCVTAGIPPRAADRAGAACRSVAWR